MVSQFGNGGLARDNFRCDEVMIMRAKGRSERALTIPLPLPLSESAKTT